MNATKLPARLPLSLVFLLALAAALLPAPARAQECGAGWTEPVVCEVELALYRQDDRRGERFTGGTLRLATRTEIELEAVAVDQEGRRFPDDRFVYSVVPSRYCDDLVSVEALDDGGVRLETGSGTGDCELLVQVANNLNLDRRIRVQVERARRDGFARTEAEVLANWLYRAVLGREGDPQGLQNATAEIQKGELGPLVRSFVASPEFQNRRGKLSAVALLESFYQGLLGRAPDTAGVRTYLDDMERGEYDDVLWALLRSDELQERLDEELE